MIIKIGKLRLLADSITAIFIDEKNSTIYTTGGAIPCPRGTAEYVAEAWEEFDGEIEEEREEEEEAEE